MRPGDDLYTDCVLALDPDTGKLKWYFQFTPHDLFDFDAVETPILIDAVYQGAARKLLVQANRNGYIYVLDRTNGKFLSATPFVDKLNWAKGIDAQGRPELTGIQPAADGTRVCPGYSGATNWFAPSYSELTHSVYFMALEECETYFFKPQTFQEGQGLLLDRSEAHSERNIAEGSDRIQPGYEFDCLEISANRRGTLFRRDHGNGGRPGVFRGRCGLV